MAEQSLSTAWNKDRYKHMGELVNDTREFGYNQIELYSNLTADQLSELLGVGGIVISSVHCPCPVRPSPSGLQKGDLSLSALSTKARRKALEEAQLTIELASRAGAKAVILHAGYVKLDISLIVKMRQLFQQGGAASKEYEEIKKQCIKERSSKAKDHLQAAEESLGILTDCAVQKGVMLGLENRVNYHEIPLLEEMEYFLTAFEGKPIGYWHDVGHAEVQDRLGFCSHNEWLSRVGSRMIGVHLHDVRGIDDHYAPGIGDLDWDLILRNIPKGAIRVCEIANWNAPSHVSEAVIFLRSKGILNDVAQE